MNPINKIQNPLISVPLGREAHKYAQRFASQQVSPEKVKQVYLNTLAVYAVSSYLKWLGYKTNMTQGESWHPVMRLYRNVADLVLPNIGKLECRPVEQETVMTIPPEAQEDRIGYIAVQFPEGLTEAKLLGFHPPVLYGKSVRQIPITQLQELEDVIDYIYDLELKAKRAEI